MNAPTIERRTLTGITFRAVETDLAPGEIPRQFWARVLNYMVLDTYNTMFDPGAFTDALTQRLPRLLYGHNWDSPGALLGRAIDYRNTPEGLDLLFEFDDFDAVPTARQVAYQVRSGTIDQFSIGFSHERRFDKPHPDIPGATIIGRGALEETSCVIKGSVPGTKTLQLIRSPKEHASMDVNEAATIIARVALGELTAAEALTQVETAARKPTTDGTMPFIEKRALAGSFDDVRKSVCDAICDRIEELTGTEPDCWIVDISATDAVYCVGDCYDEFWQVGYTIDGMGMVTLGAPFEVERVVSWVAEAPEPTDGMDRTDDATEDRAPLVDEAEAAALLAEADALLADLS